MTFNNDCWLQVQDAANNRLYSGVKKANQTLKLTGKAPYKLVIGAPSAVTLTYKGKPVDLSAYPAGKVARLTLPQ
jgi:cytoskeleton protein RodZ